MLLMEKPKKRYLNHYNELLNKTKGYKMDKEQRDLLVELVRRKRIKLLNILRYEKSCSDYVNAEKTTNEINLCSKTLVTLQKI